MTSKQHDFNIMFYSGIGYIGYNDFVHVNHVTSFDVVLMSCCSVVAVFSYCKFGNFREGFIFAKLRICQVS